MTVLTTFGVDEDSELLYRSVLRQDRKPVRWHADSLAWTDSRVVAAMLPLVRLRLVRQDLSGALVAPHPRAALSRLVDRENARLELRRRELEDAAAAVGDFSADHLAGRIDTLSTDALEAVPDDLRSSTAIELLRTTTGPLRLCHRWSAAGVHADDEVERVARRAMRTGREIRALYPSSVLDVPEQRAWVRRWSVNGERQRVTGNLPANFAVFGDEVVIAAPQEPAPGEVIGDHRQPLCPLDCAASLIASRMRT